MNYSSSPVLIVVGEEHQQRQKTGFLLVLKSKPGRINIYSVQLTLISQYNPSQSFPTLSRFACFGLSYI
ncbi:MAG: hypothetical protein EHM58_20205 [Ignavibacteriae bacterium]|nr:MAG: hypothetical protein EHM58_20205 [Ignavibacteriota bacterium]